MSNNTARATKIKVGNISIAYNNSAKYKPGADGSGLFTKSSADKVIAKNKLNAKKLRMDTM